LKRHWFFAFFFISGACSLIYEVVWLRLSMAKFGVTTPMVSIVISVFMAGLGLGSWAGGKLIGRFDQSPAAVPLRLYGALELLIGLSGLVVPRTIDAGYALLRDCGGEMGWGSLVYYLSSGACMTVALLPWCTAMGATFPFAMAAIRKTPAGNAERSFSYLYLANLLGALFGTLVPAIVLIELYGFRGTLHIATALNVALAAAVFLLSSTLRKQAERQRLPEAPSVRDSGPAAPAGLLWLLFATGFCSMAIEVVWIRQFTIYLGSVVYAFAAILALYLSANYIGSSVYRKWVGGHDPKESRTVWIVMGLAALLPLLVADPRFPIPGELAPNFSAHSLWGMLRAALGVMPFSALVGFATPMLVDRVSGGKPDLAGRAYAVNVLGSILGPLIAGFCLLPWVGERGALCVFAAPLFAAGFASAARAPQGAGTILGLGPRPLFSVMVFLCVPLTMLTKGYEAVYADGIELRDYTATVIASGTGMDRRLLTNGIGMTNLTTVTKMMAHIPLSLLRRPAASGLVICFGMGTTFRSMLSWGIHATAVELVPSVPKLFGYFHPDGPALLRSPGARVVIDDGRRFLERTGEQFDVITVDPPPPVSAPASSLLYSREFCGILKRHLRSGGIVQIWLPGGDVQTKAAVARALLESFPHVHAFGSIDSWGTHFLASNDALPEIAPGRLPQPLPAAAVRDLVEWLPDCTPDELFGEVLSEEVPMKKFLDPSPRTPAIQDDRPINEYFLLRKAWPSLNR